MGKEKEGIELNERNNDDKENETNNDDDKESSINKFLRVVVQLVVAALLLLALYWFIVWILNYKDKNVDNICSIELNDPMQCRPLEFSEYCYTTYDPVKVEECKDYCNEIFEEFMEDNDENLWCEYEYCIQYNGYENLRLCGCITPQISFPTFENKVYIKHSRTGLYLNIEDIPSPPEGLPIYTFVGILPVNLTNIAKDTSNFIPHLAKDGLKFLLQSSKYNRYGINLYNGFSFIEPYFYNNQGEYDKELECALYSGSQSSTYRIKTNDDKFLAVENGVLIKTDDCVDTELIEWEIEISESPFPSIFPLNPNNLGSSLRFVANCNDHNDLLSGNTFFLNVSTKKGTDTLHLLKDGKGEYKDIISGKAYWAWSNAGVITHPDDNQWVAYKYQGYYVNKTTYIPSGTYAVTDSNKQVAFKNTNERECRCTACDIDEDEENCNPGEDCKGSCNCSYCYEYIYSSLNLICVKHKCGTCMQDPTNQSANICVEDPELYNGLCNKCAYKDIDPYVFGLVFDQIDNNVRLFLSEYPFETEPGEIERKTLFPSLEDNLYFIAFDEMGTFVNFFVQKSNEYKVVNCIT